MGTLVLVCSARAFAQTVELAGEYGATAQVVRPLAARNDEDATAAATSVDLTTRPLALETMRDVMPEVPGALMMSGGGYGSFSSVSLRGTDLGHTVWLLGDVPLNGPDIGAFDTSLLPLPQLGKLEVFRGGAPVWYGQGSIGGVIRVLPREGESTGASAQLGAGSFGRYELRGQSFVSRAGPRELSLYTGVQATRVRNDFPYRDNGLPYDQNDDATRRLANAELQDGAGLMHLRVAALGGHFDVLAYGLERSGGLPSAAHASSHNLDTHQLLRRGMSTLAYTREGRSKKSRHRYRVQLLGSAQADSRDLNDPNGTIGTGGPSARSQSFWRATGRAAASFELTSFLEATLVTTFAEDHFEDHERLGPSPRGPSRRRTGAVAPELRLFGQLLGMRGEVRGSIRGEWTRTSFNILRVSQPVHEEVVLDSRVYRIAGALEPAKGLTLRGSFGTGRRSPSIMELFGDGGALKANFDLLPERGKYADLGGVLSEAFGPVCAVIEANGFASRVDQRITYATNSQGQSVALNVGHTDVLGVELGGEASYRRVLRVVGATTLMKTETDTGKQLPRQPKLRSYGRVEGSKFFARAVDRLTLFGTVEHLSTAYFDTSNTVQPRAPLTQLGAGLALSLLAERIELQGRVSDLLNQMFRAPGPDYMGLPLPGRSFAFLVSFREESK